ncbi:somatostatin-2-like [Pundamilia nyererei]|uniref:Somatostatin-2 n=1 Tax=Pundamilia nyererei TaxID=303518 RepID=A0A9Y3RBS1_9CICH|nr:PREDICTED: somatostatin-2-like [Pundamilia nyererei]
MDFCLTCKSEFLHHLAARRLSISHAASCDPQEEEHQASKGQHPQHQDQREPRTRTSTRTSRRNQTSTSMQCVRCPAILVLMALVLCSTRVSSQPDRDQLQDPDLELELELRNHRLLQRPRSAGFLSQEWSKRAVEDLLAQMSLPEADVQREAEATGGRMNLERSADQPNSIPPRERKAGCKNFYWKGLTSC